jgi:threonine/homoserine/homoserine lactone efflux protein
VGDGIGAVLPFAAAIALSPIPIIAVILMLFSQRARVNGPAFLAGWVVGLTLLSVITYAAAGALGAGDSDDSGAVAWLRIVLGAFLLVLAARKLRGSKEAAPEDLPAWMAKIDALAPGRAAVLGVLLSSLNPKNLVLGVAAIVGLAQLDLPTAEAATGIVVFVLVASSSIACSVTYYLLGGQSAQTRLQALKDWMEQHNDAIMAVLFIIFGVVLIAQGVSGLS